MSMNNRVLLALLLAVSLTAGSIQVPALTAAAAEDSSAEVIEDRDISADSSVQDEALEYEDTSEVIYHSEAATSEPAAEIEPAAETEAAESATEAATEIEPVEEASTTESAAETATEIESATETEPASEAATGEPAAEGNTAAEGDTVAVVELAPEQTQKKEKKVAAGTIGLSVMKHSQDEIRSFIASHPIARIYSLYSETPSVTAPYSPGKLADKTVNYALNMLNLMRYIAGIDADVTIKESYAKLTQAGALMMAANKVLTHTPDTPAGMSDELAGLGTEGCFNSNITSSSGSPAAAVLAFIKDEGSDNRKELGHRNWVLHPLMKQTGFGMATYYTAMYATDHSRGSSAYTNVAWPGQNMPLEFFDSDDMWSVSFESLSTLSGISVKLVRKSDGKVWNFSENAADGEFYTNNNSCGYDYCVIFRPEGISYNSGDHFDVTINGVGDKALQYSVDFFSLCGGSHNYTDETKVQEATCTQKSIFQSYCPKCGGISTRYGNKLPHNVDPKSYSKESMKNGVVTVNCSDCGQTMTGSVPTEYRTEWSYPGIDGSTYSSDELPGLIKIGSTAEYFIWLDESSSEAAECLEEYTVTTTDQQNCVLENADSISGTIRFKKEGTYTVTVTPAFNPDAKKTFKVTVVDPQTCKHTYGTYAVNEVEPTCTEGGQTGDLYCNGCGKLIKSNQKLSPTGHEWITWDSDIIKTATPTANGTRKYHCTKCSATKTASYKFTPYKLANGRMTISKATFVYNGKVQRPSVKVKGYFELPREYYSVIYSKGCKTPGTYKVIAKLKGYYTGTYTRTFQIRPKSTVLTKLTPRAGKVGVKWKKQSVQTTGYQIQLATDSKFTKNKKLVIVKGAKKCGKTISGLLRGRKYYVRVRTYKTVNGRNYCSSWSKYKTVKVK